MVRCCKVETDACCLLDIAVTVEFSTVIGGDGFHVVAVRIDEGYYTAVQGLFGPVFEFADDEVAGFALDQGNDAILGVVTHDGIDLPVTDGAPCLDASRSFTDVAFARQATAAIVGTVALTSVLRSAAKVSVQRATRGPVGPDVLIDGFVADQEDAVTAQEAGNLFRTPALAQVAMNNGEVVGIELGVASRVRAAMAASAIGPERPVMSIVGTSITPQFSGDGAGRSAELSGNVRL